MLWIVIIPPKTAAPRRSRELGGVVNTRYCSGPVLPSLGLEITSRFDLGVGVDRIGTLFLSIYFFFRHAPPPLTFLVRACVVDFLAMVNQQRPRHTLVPSPCAVNLRAAAGISEGRERQIEW